MWSIEQRDNLSAAGHNEAGEMWSIEQRKQGLQRRAWRNGDAFCGRAALFIRTEDSGEATILKRMSERGR
jgi:hypothetical protein